MAAPWLASLPHSKKFLGSNPPSGLSVWSLHLFLVSVLVCSAAPASSHSPMTCMGLG